MTVYKISLSDAQADKLADYLSGDVGEQIRAQIPKPAIEEPKEFGSIVRAVAGLIGNDTLWQRSPGHGEHYWESETGAVEVWSELTDVEVLRVGVDGLPPLTAADLSRMSVEANKNGTRTKRVCISDVAPCGEQDCNSCYPPESDAEADAFRRGELSGGVIMAGRIHNRLQKLLAEAITSERKNAYEKAIQAVEELAP